MNPKRSFSIQKFLELNTHSDLAALYNSNMEIQCNMAQDGGHRVDKHFRGHDWHVWSDGVQEWSTFRIPRNAWTDPIDNDNEIKFDLSLHVEAIGMSGWDWQNRCSRWVGFDFDAIVGHSDRHNRKLSDEQLSELRNAVQNIEYVSLRWSTSGNGLHLYVFLDPPVSTANHVEHMALARAILSQLSMRANFDFKSKVDGHGNILWIWHRKMAASTEQRGLTLIKQGIPLSDIPSNWKDHLSVVKGNRSRIIPFFIKEAKEKGNTDLDTLFDELSGQRPRIPLDIEHNKLLDWLRNNIAGGSWWDQDHWMLVTHTHYLKLAHEHLQLKGIFRTIAQGSDPGDHNAFCLAGDTLIKTYKGVFSLQELANADNIKVWSFIENYGMRWTDAEVKSFGLQQLYSIYIENEIVIKATPLHRWPYFNEDNIPVISYSDYKLTNELKIGDRLVTKNYYPAKITNITYSTKFEEVFCAVVPKHHNFTLANGIITHNCFPLSNGAWTVRRYTPGVIEDPTWQQDGQGWTRCYLNKLPDFRTACTLFGGLEKKTGGFLFPSTKIAVEVCSTLGLKVDIPDWAANRQTLLKKHKDGRLLFEFERAGQEKSDDMKGWVAEKKEWTRVFDFRLNVDSNVEVPNFDKLIRHTIRGDKGSGWVVNQSGAGVGTGTGNWVDEPLEHVKLMLKGGFAFKQNEVESIIANAIGSPWWLVNRPFEPEFLPERQWNRGAVKFKFERSQNIEELKFPTWEKIFNHLGEGLDYAVQSSAWAKANNVLSGSDYLMLWVASLFQRPFVQLPYLFFWSDKQDTGKSIFHESLKRLMSDSGYIIINSALDPNATFNAEMQNAILCVVEEKELNNYRNTKSNAYEKIKMWVTARDLLIHEKNKTPYMIPNTCHFIHTANSRLAAPVFPGDTKIVVVYVNPIDDLEKIPKYEMEKMLDKEASDFLAAIMMMQIPESNDRLGVPSLATEEKIIAQEANMSPLEIFIQEHCHNIDGETIPWGEFYDRFVECTEPKYIELWTKRYTGKHMPPYMPIARNSKDLNSFHVGNVSWTAADPNAPKKPRLIRINNTLRTLNEITHKTDSSVTSVNGTPTTEVRT